MNIDAKKVIQVSELLENHVKATSGVASGEEILVTNNNVPQYLLIPINPETAVLSDNTKIVLASNKILKKYKKAFKELAK